MASSSNVYSGYQKQFSKLILKLENEIVLGKNHQEKINQLIREYLIGIQLSDINPLKVINEIDKSIQKNFHLGLDLETKYDSLLSDIEIYLSSINEYSEALRACHQLSKPNNRSSQINCT
ncbi:MAG: hypothetical protein KME21_04455 [Desmonostoc vinosum HA7617-LM4]|jgi:hypothetical protein|nr:hypothetical protein [Desmonostoc vinosum HA7617-LM4]